MIFESFTTFIKQLSRIFTNETFTHHIIISKLFQLSQFCKLINNNTENDIQECNVDDNKEQQVKEEPEIVIFSSTFLIWAHLQHIANTTTHSQSIIQSCQEAMPHINTSSLTSSGNCIIIVTVICKEEAHQWENEDEHDSQKGSQTELSGILGHSLDYILQCNWSVNDI